ncbi:MAG TPA: hypothetical protein VF933_16410 [Streptosporangiaceae bacterium]
MTAVPDGESVRAWISGTGTGWPRVVPAFQGAEPFWFWRHHQKTGAHPREDIAGAAAAVTRVLADDPP